MSASAPAPTLPLPAPRRPIGLILAAIALALMTCMGLLSGAMMVLVSTFIHSPETAQFPAIKMIGIGIGVLTLLISGFCVWTVVGLFRVRKWARISILILGGLVALFALLGALSSVVAALGQSMVPQSSPGLPPGTMKIVLLGTAAFYFCVGLIGVWWLVYFNLRRVRAVFTAYGALRRNGVASPPSMWIDPNVQRHSAIGILVNCLAALYILGAVSGLVCAFLHLPLFFLGHIFHGTPAALFLLITSAIGIGIATGLVRRMKVAWIAALVFNALGVISELALVVPANRAAIGSYQQEIFARMFHAFPMRSTIQLMPDQTIIIGAISGTLMFIAIFWLLIRARSLFQPG
jgi:hypothetical protein